MEKIDKMSMDIEKNEKEKLKSVFPGCFVEGKLDIDKLLNMCGEYIVPESEKYEFTWSGKFEALKLAQKRSTATLRPSTEESVNFDTTQNLYIEGDNLEVLKLLQTSYYRKVKMIYIDPPYNTGKDFVYEDNFKDPLEYYKEITSQATKSNPESMGRFHTNWLNMMFPRLRLAYNLLSDDGVIFISIDDHEVHNLRKLCDEVFGEENFVCEFIWRKKAGGANDSADIATEHEYVICYRKNKNGIYKIPLDEKRIKEYKYQDEKVKTHGKYTLKNLNDNSLQDSSGLHFDIICPDGTILKGNEHQWKCNKETFEKRLKDNRIIFNQKSNGEWTVNYKIYLNEEKGELKLNTDGEIIQKGRNQNSIILDVLNKDGNNDLKLLFGENKPFNYPKPVSLIKKLLLCSTKSEDIILDFFSGSATTAHAVMELNKEDGGNRKFIMVQLPEVCDEKSEAFKAGYKNICEIGKERIRRAGKKLLESVKEESPQQSKDEAPLPLDVGFKVLKLDSSNFDTWDPIFDQDDIEELERRLNSVTGEAKADRTDLDIIFETLLKLGIEMTEKITKMEFDGKTAYSIGEDNLLVICLDSDISTETVEKMADLAPAYIIFGQNSLTTLTAMSNAKLLLRDKKIDMKFV